VERGRVYVPLDMLQRFGVAPEDLLRIAKGAPLNTDVRGMLRTLGADAWRYYNAGEALIPLIDADSRAALWVLVRIYSGLLKRIDARDGDVFSERVSVPTSAKVLILAQGAAMALRNRMVS
jgi:15-cis-phytoene synthase